MFSFLQSEDDLDAYIAERPCMADVGNELQDVVESEEGRVLGKRCAVLIELQVSHYENCEYEESRLGLGGRAGLYFEAVEEASDAFLFGMCSADAMVRRFEGVRRVFMEKDREPVRGVYRRLACVAESSRVGALAGMGSEFARRFGEELASREKNPDREGDHGEDEESPGAGLGHFGSEFA